ncbi:putative ABC transport system permease protein [Saccharothrix tamanrassetensis]|uniref:Putative ABC transport system permease protein n=1 Tax=Saccharothrix tamanrassetensis TaxID=1051531 RepID=A0A841CI08_9PSEU|nr:ABC transporter permease [Saccharothrix tamanrassetensis]MBB5956939.1 putative ABC transport system permease protein [Saccharothrix tamanrassetensis]
MQIPWRAAPRAALSSPLTLIVSLVTALLLSFVVAAAVMHSAASGSAAVDYQQDRLCTESLHPSLEMRSPPEQVTPLLDAVRQTVGDQPMLPATYTREARADFGGKQTYAKFGFRPGATDRLTVLEGGSKDGLWVPKSIAMTTDLQLGKRGMGGRLPPVTAIYADLRDPLDAWWCSERSWVIPNTYAKYDLATSVVWMPSAASFADLPRELAGTVDVTVRFPSAVPRTVDEAEDLLATGTARVKPIADQGVRVVSQLVLPVENAHQTVGNVRSAILPLTLISLLIGLAGVATVTVQWAQRRHTELRLLWVRGSGPAALGGRALLELGLPLVVGGALGLGVGRLLVPVYAPSTALPPGTSTTASAAVLVVIALSVATTWATAAVRTHRMFQAATTGTRVRRVLAAVPWELATAGLAVWAWNRVQHSGLATPLKIGGLPRIDAAALAFPLLVVLTTALLAARVARWALKASHRASLWSKPPAQLAIRRLAAAAGPVTGVLLVGVLAIGTIAVGSSIAGSQKTALEFKSGTYTGAESFAQVADDTVLPDVLRGNSTIVGLSEKNEQVVLVVDPKTFNDGAFGHDVDPALLSRPLRIGSAPRREVTLPGLPAINPEEHLPSFPKLGTSGWVVPRDKVTSADDVGSWYVWSAKPLGELTEALADAGIKYRNVGEKKKAVSGLPFLTIQWTFGFVTAIGAVLAVVAAIALLLAIEVRRRQNAVSGAFSTRMGLRPAALLSSHLLELGALAVAALAVGLTASMVSSGFAVPKLDPAPRLTPTPELPDVFPLLVTTVAGSAAVVLVAAWIAVRAVRSARIGELIRD